MEKERCVTYILGLPVMERVVYGGRSMRESSQDNSQDSYLDRQARAHDYGDYIHDALSSFSKPAWQIICAVLVLVMAYLSFQYIAIQNCPDKLAMERAQTTMSQCEAKYSEASGSLRITREKYDKLVIENANTVTKKVELESKLEDVENKVNSLTTDLELVKKQEKKLQEENRVLTEQKESISKDLTSTKYTLGTCKNKNMDHEVRSLELLQEIESLKKELKAC